MALLTYQVVVIEDPSPPHSERRRPWQVRILAGNRLIGIPLRGRTELQARAARDAIAYAYKFGVDEGLKAISNVNVLVGGAF